MPSATEFIDTVGINLPEHFSANEFLCLAREGMITQEHLRSFALAEFQSQEAELAAYGLLLARYPHEVPGSFFSFVGHELMQARHRMVGGLAPALGMSPDEMRRAPRLEPVRRFTEFISWVALHAGAAEAALLARTDFTLWCNTCAVLADVLGEAKHVPEAAVEYIGAYRENPPEVADGVLQVIEYGRTQHEPDEWITRSAVRMEPTLRAWWRAVATTG
ncbi:hypothetical protein [Streptomyces sp. NRRL S-1521]|uniref:hypothetical protein n=1 Tax=Streptomyces sp. NRRL S-1521 TaxID=1609100 RepID=UPI00074810E0|nr:hypothetical protein [Streptomyces sp. NRRL S-1521]KUL50400.1 hypothetical protein ADL30_29940 [Streptomyces sp. NRRL S-1521]